MHSDTFLKKLFVFAATVCYSMRGGEKIKEKTTSNMMPFVLNHNNGNPRQSGM